MKLSYQQLANHRQWLSEQHPSLRQLHSSWRSWLLDQGSLTEKLITFSDDQFSVNVLRQFWAKPLPHEARKLNVPLDRAAYIREVELLCGGQAVVFARSIIPQSAWGAGSRQLSKIGNRPLGHFLFQKGRMRISKREIAVIEKDNTCLVARRTPYKYQHNDILVSEFFLPTFLQQL